MCARFQNPGIPSTCIIVPLDLRPYHGMNTTITKQQMSKTSFLLVFPNMSQIKNTPDSSVWTIFHSVNSVMLQSCLSPQSVRRLKALMFVPILFISWLSVTSFLSYKIETAEAYLWRIAFTGKCSVYNSPKSRLGCRWSFC